MTKTFTARIADVLHWDQAECSVLLVPGSSDAVAELRRCRGKQITVTVELPAPEGQRELFERK